MKKIDFKINSKLFSRLFASYLLCMLLPMAIFTSLVLVYTQTTIRKNAVEAYSSVQEANISNFEDTIREVYNTAFRLSAESGVKNLNSQVYTDKVEMNFEIKDVMASLRISGSRIFQTNSASVALYFDRNGIVVAPDGKYSYEHYMEDIIKMDGWQTDLEYFHTYFRENSRPLILSAGNGEKLTYVVSMDSFSNNSSTYVIATIPILSVLSTGLEDVPWVIHTDQGLLFTNQPITEGSDGPMLLSETEEQLYSGQYYKLTQEIPSVSLQCTMFLDSQSIQGQMKNIYFILFFAVMAVAVLGACVSYYLSKYNYKPIDRILRIIRPYRQQSGSEEKSRHIRDDEEAQISSTIKTLISNNSQLKMQILEKLPSLQQSLLSRLLKEPIAREKDPGDLEFYHLDFSLPSFAVLQGSIQGASDLASDVVRSLVSAIISQQSPLYNIYTVEDFNNGISIIVNFDPEQEKLEDIVKRLRRMLPTYMLLGCSLPADGIEGLHRCYAQAVEALGGCFAEESLLTFYQDDGKKKFFSLTIEQENALDSYIKERKTDLVHTMLGNILEESAKYGAGSVKFLKVFYYDLLAFLLRTASNAGLNPAELWPEEMEEKFSRSSGEDRIRALEHLADQICSNIGASTTARASSMQEKLLTYIHENYSNPDLSLNMVARTFNISSQYLSSFFKSHMGQNYIEYITQYRLRHALELLKNTDHSVQEIAHMVGYTDAGHFIRVFKRYYSLTPGQYRAQ